MGYRGVSTDEYRNAPRFEWIEGERGEVGIGGLQQFGLAAAMLGLLVVFRARLARP
ncbi:hypothetical protein D3C87_2190280 [compost metagenome]